MEAGPENSSGPASFIIFVLSYYQAIRKRKMKGKTNRNEDLLWKMLNEELSVEAIREVQEYLRGEGDFFDMGYGSLIIEPYDGRQRSAMYRVRHEKHGEEIVNRSALASVLHDLLHYRRKQQGLLTTSSN